MNSNQPSRRAGAFTLVELLCVIAIISILAALLLPVLNQSQARVKRVECENNLHQLGIAFQVFTHDHNDKFPMAVPLAEGGSKEFVQNGYAAAGEFYFSFRPFQALANELSSPAILICPADTRFPATNFAALQNSNVSYFIGVNAEFAKPASLLAGDRNLTANSSPNPSILHIEADNRLQWTWEMHRFKGKILFAGGQVEEWNNAALASAEGQLAGADLFLPSVVPAVTYPVSGYAGNQSFSRASSGDGTPSTTSPAGRPENKSPAIPDTSGQAQPRQPTVVPTGPQNPPVTTGTNPPATNRFSTNPPVTVTIAPVGTEPERATFDVRLAKILRRLIIGTCLLVLSIFLLLLAFKLWQRARKKREQRKAGL